MKISIHTQVKAPTKKVWQIWTTPENIMQWNNATPDWHTPSASIDLVKDGTFSYRMEARDGSMGFDFTGTFSEVEPHSLIKYKLEDDREVEITFSFDGESTTVTETFEAEDQNSAEMQRQGWQAILDNFKKHAESNLS